MDGIHPVRVFFKVTLPLIKPALMVAIIFRSLDALRVFDVIYVLTANNPETMSMSVYVRQNLVDFQEVGLWLGGLHPVVPNHRAMCDRIYHDRPRAPGWGEVI